MCGGVYEDEFMGDIKFTTAEDFMREQNMKLKLDNLRHQQYMRWFDKRDILITNCVEQLTTLAREYDIPEDELVKIFDEMKDRYEKTQR